LLRQGNKTACVFESTTDPLAVDMEGKGAIFILLSRYKQQKDDLSGLKGDF
jgi:hypothetical protein